MTCRRYSNESPSRSRASRKGTSTNKQNVTYCMLTICLHILECLSMRITEQFGQNLRAYRIRLGVSQEKLAEISGLHRTYISGLESGARNPSITIVAKLANALGVEPSDLLKRCSKL